MSLENKEPVSLAEFDEKYMEAAYSKFCDIKGKLDNSYVHKFRKGKNSSGLAIFTGSNSIEISDFTQKGRKIHKLLLSYDPKLKRFNLRKTFGIEINERNDISVDVVMDILKQIEDKMNPVRIMDKTKEEISLAIKKMFSEEKKGFFG